MRTIRCAADAEGLGFLLIDNFASAVETSILASTYVGNADRYETGKADPFWDDRLLGYRDILRANPYVAKRIRDLLGIAIKSVEAFYDPPAVLYPDVMHLVGWSEGQSMPPHADNANVDGSPHELFYRDYSGVLYLNDGYEGGELYLPEQDAMVVPQAGMFISMPAGLSHLHGVHPVKRGLRITLATFLTHDAARADRVLLDSPE